MFTRRKELGYNSVFDLELRGITTNWSSLKHEVNLNKIQNFSFCLKFLFSVRKIINIIYKEIISLHFENHTKVINALCGHNTVILNYK